MPRPASPRQDAGRRGCEGHLAARKGFFGLCAVVRAGSTSGICLLEGLSLAVARELCNKGIQVARWSANCSPMSWHRHTCSHTCKETLEASAVRQRAKEDWRWKLRLTGFGISPRGAWDRKLRHLARAIALRGEHGVVVRISGEATMLWERLSLQVGLRSWPESDITCVSVQRTSLLPAATAEECSVLVSGLWLTLGGLTYLRNLAACAWFPDSCELERWDGRCWSQSPGCVGGAASRKSCGQGGPSESCSSSDGGRALHACRLALLSTHGATARIQRFFSVCDATKRQKGIIDVCRKVARERKARLAQRFAPKSVAIWLKPFWPKSHLRSRSALHRRPAVLASFLCRAVVMMVKACWRGPECSYLRRRVLPLPPFVG